MNDPFTFQRKSKSKFQLMPTDNETGEEKNEAMWRYADTTQAVESEQHHVCVMRHLQSICITGL
jgi:uncharacterized protein (DUF427 family)